MKLTEKNKHNLNNNNMDFNKFFQKLIDDAPENIKGQLEKQELTFTVKELTFLLQDLLSGHGAVSGYSQAILMKALREGSGVGSKKDFDETIRKLSPFLKSFIKERLKEGVPLEKVLDMFFEEAEKKK